MGYLFTQIWLPIILALVLGLFVGWLSCRAQEDAGPDWLKPAAIGFAVAVLVAALRLLPGFLGLALEAAILLFGAYVVGCVLACRLYFFIQPSSDAADKASPPSPSH